MQVNGSFTLQTIPPRKWVRLDFNKSSGFADQLSDYTLFKQFPEFSYWRDEMYRT
jgi:hypothetical protein